VQHGTLHISVWYYRRDMICVTEQRPTWADAFITT